MKRIISLFLAIMLMLNLVSGTFLFASATEKSGQAGVLSPVSQDSSSGQQESREAVPGSSFETAIVLVEEEHAFVQFTYPDELVYYSFVPTYNEDYCLHSLSGPDSFGYLYDAEGNQLAFHDDIPFDWNFSLHYDMIAGKTYYFAVGTHSSAMPCQVEVSLFGSHDLVSEELKEANCTQEGLLYWYCQCGYSYTEIVPKVHEYQDGACVLCGIDEVYTGQIGDLTWTFHAKTATLRVSGNGPMTCENTWGGYGWEEHRNDIRSIIVEDGVTTIGFQAFDNMDNVESVSIADTVVAIEKGAFTYNVGLQSIVIPDSVTTIGEEAFYGCKRLIYITLGNGLTTLGDYCFMNCDNLTEITLPKSFTTFGEDVFNNCTNLIAIQTAPDHPYFTTDEFGVLYNKDRTELVRFPLGIMGQYIMSEGEVGRYVVPDSVVTIGDYAFSDCGGLYQVILPEGLKTIGNHGFSYCRNLWKANIPDSVTTIGEYAFSGCGIRDVNLSGNITSLGARAFNWCRSLREVTVGGNITYLDDYVFAYCDGMVTIVIEEGVTSLGENVFYDCRDLREVHLPNSLTTIGKWAFDNCYSLESVTIPENVASIGSQAFSSCESLMEIRVMENNRFYSSDASGVLFDKEKTTLIHYPIGLEGDYEIPRSVTTVADNAFSFCKGLTDISIGKGVKTIGENAFEHCSALTELTVPGNVETIGRCAFWGCDALKTVTIEDGVKIIDSHAFSGNNAMTGVIIGDGIEKIEDYAFGNNDSLLHVHFEGELPEFNSLSFGQSNPDVMIYEKEAYGNWVQGELIVAPDCGTPGKLRQSCPECGVERIVSVEPTGKHTWENGSCILCGIEETPVAIEDPALKINHTLNLASDISVNFVVPKALLAGYDMDTVYMLATVDLYKGNEKTGERSIRMYPVENGMYYYFTLTNMTAVHMGDEIRSVLYGVKDGQHYYSPEDTYSIATYAYAQMDKTFIPDRVKQLCADLLRYGTKTQIFKSYRTDHLADGNMTEAHKAYLSDLESVTFGNNNRVMEDVEDPHLTWVGKTLSLESKVCLKFVFEIDHYVETVAGLTLRVRYVNGDGEEQNLTLENPKLYNPVEGYFAFTLDSLLASELRSVLSVQIYDGDKPVSYTLEYSADTYGNNKTGALGDLCKALFAYSDSAKAFFG